MTYPDRPADLTCDDVRDLAGSFVLGALPPTEAEAIRAHLASCPEAHAEIAELGSVLPVLDASVPQVEPSTALKGRILAAAAAEPNVASRPSEPIAPAAPPAAEPVVAAPLAAAPIPFPSADERTDRAAAKRGASPLAWVLRIAAVVAIVALTGWNLLLQGQLTDAQRYEANVAAVVAAAQQPGSVAAILSPDSGTTGSGIAAITAAGAITMALQDLAPTTGGQVYEAWVIGADQVPVALGSFEVGRAGTAFMNGETVPATPGLVLALTLEPGPGATSPSGPVITKGVATSTG